MDPVQSRRAHETLMHNVNREVRYISYKYSMQIYPLYFEGDKFILMLENHFPYILEEPMKCTHQMYVSVHNQGQSIPASSSELNTNFRCGVTDGE